MRRGKRKKRSVEETVFSACLLLIVVVFGYGVLRYPNAPIRLDADGTYRDKFGSRITEAEFHGSILWERCLYGSFAILVASGIPFVVSKHRRQRGR
jgi:hypothetical protein